MSNSNGMVRMKRSKIVCPLCQAKDWRARVKTQDFLCRKCGTVFGTAGVDKDYVDVYVKTTMEV